MEEEKTTLCYSLGEGLKGRKDSVSVRHYIAHMKSEGTFRDADLWEAMAKETGRDADYIRYLEGVRRRAIIAALKSGKRVSVGGVALAATIKGTFDTIDGEFDPSRNELAVTGFTYGDFQDARSRPCRRPDVTVSWWRRGRAMARRPWRCLSPRRPA